MDAPRIGLVGIGNMGLPMALNLIDRGHRVLVRDIRDAPEKQAVAAGAQVCASAAEMARCVDLMILVLVDAEQIESVLFGPDGAASALRANNRVMVCSTIAPADTERFSERLAGFGVELIDAPISGGPARARDGSMSIMLACPDTTLAELQPLLSAMATKLFHVGERIGDGARAKLVNNLLAGIHLSAAAEAFTLADRLGLDLRRLYDIVCASSGHSWILADRLGRALADDFAPRAQTRILTKDLGLATQAAALAGCQTPLGDRALELFRATCAQGMADLDDAAVLLGARQTYASPQSDRGD